MDKQRYDFIIEVLRGIHTVKALALNAAMMRRAALMKRRKMVKQTS